MIRFAVVCVCVEGGERRRATQEIGLDFIDCKPQRFQSFKLEHLE